MKKIGLVFGTLAFVFGLLNPGWSQEQIPDGPLGFNRDLRLQNPGRGFCRNQEDAID